MHTVLKFSVQGFYDRTLMHIAHILMHTQTHVRTMTNVFFEALQKKDSDRCMSIV